MLEMVQSMGMAIWVALALVMHCGASLLIQLRIFLNNKVIHIHLPQAAIPQGNRGTLRRNSEYVSMDSTCSQNSELHRTIVPVTSCTKNRNSLLKFESRTSIVPKDREHH